MKKVLLLPLAILMTTSLAWAEAHTDYYQCSGNLPKGEASMIVRYGEKGPESIVLKFTNEALHQIFDGTFLVTYFQSGGGADGMNAEGEFHGDGATIKANIQGSLTPNEQGSVNVTVYAGADHRIEYGYGQWLSCSQE